jgi:hypothetical protein
MSRMPGRCDVAIIIRRKVYFGDFQRGGPLANAPLYLIPDELAALEAKGSVIARDGYEYQVLKPKRESERVS